MDKNAFKEIESKEKLPDNIKRETLGSLFSMKMLADCIDLFVVKAGAAISTAIDGGNSIEESKKS